MYHGIGRCQLLVVGRHHFQTLGWDVGLQRSTQIIAFFLGHLVGLCKKVAQAVIDRID